MSNFAELAQWENFIYQLDTTDPVLGGEGGVSNIQGAQLANRTAYLKQKVEYAAPPSAVMAFARSTAPAGWLKCDGAAVSRETYADLFDAIGTTFGAGDGSTTFNLPDMRGEFVRGYDDGKGTDPARVFGSQQTDDFKQHRHSITFKANDFFAAGNSVNWPGNVLFPNATGTDVQTFDTNVGGTETRPKNIALLYCIKI